MIRGSKNTDKGSFCWLRHSHHFKRANHLASVYQLLHLETVHFFFWRKRGKWDVICVYKSLFVNSNSQNSLQQTVCSQWGSVAVALVFFNSIFNLKLLDFLHSSQTCFETNLHPWLYPQCFRFNRTLSSSIASVVQLGVLDSFDWAQFQVGSGCLCAQSSD